MREELIVHRDALADGWVTDNWQQLVEELFPLEISQLFFFDAEKIRTLAETETGSKALEAAIKSLLGLDIVERLIADSVVLQSRLARRVGSAEERAQGFRRLWIMATILLLCALPALVFVIHEQNVAAAKSRAARARRPLSKPRPIACGSAETAAGSARSSAPSNAKRCGAGRSSSAPRSIPSNR